MSKPKRWRSYDDFQDYLDQMELTYDVTIEVQFIPSPQLEANETYIVLKATSNDVNPSSPQDMAVGRYRVSQWPQERLTATLLGAASQFMYAVLSAHLEWLG